VFWCPLLRAQGTVQTSAREAIPRHPSPEEAEREVSWRTLPRNFLLDQKDIWLFPVRLAEGRHWLPAVAVTGVTAGLIAADPHDTPYFRRTARFEGFNKVFSGRNTSAIMAGFPSAFLVVGYFRHDSYTEHTALLAGEAYADSAIVDVVMKMTTRRLRPSDIAPNDNFSNIFSTVIRVSAAQVRAFLRDMRRPRFPSPRSSRIVTASIAGFRGLLTA